MKNRTVKISSTYVFTYERVEDYHCVFCGVKGQLWRFVEEGEDIMLRHTEVMGCLACQMTFGLNVHSRTDMDIVAIADAASKADDK